MKGSDRWQLLAPLRHRDFRLLLLGQSVSRLGDRIYAIALPFQLFALGASPLELGLAVAILDTSHLLLLLVGGAVADRIPRRRLILASDLVAGISVGALALLSWTGQLAIAHVYVASAIFGAAEAFLAPAYTALIPELVPKDILQSGNAARSFSRSLARVAGPAAGGVVVVGGGPALGFGIDALTFLVSFTTLLFVRAPRREPPPAASLLADVREGIAFTLTLPWVIAGALAYAVLNIAYAGQTSVIMPLLVRDVLHGDAGTFGSITAAFGVGAVLAGLVLAQARVARAGVGIYVFELAAALSVVGMGILAQLPAVIVLMLVIGVALTGSDVLWQTALQRHVRTDMLGRVSSITSLGIYLLNPVSPLVAGLLVERLGPAVSLTLLGAYSLIVATLLLFASPLRHVR